MVLGEYQFLANMIISSSTFFLNIVNYIIIIIISPGGIPRGEMVKALDWNLNKQVQTSITLLRPHTENTLGKGMSPLILTAMD